MGFMYLNNDAVFWDDNALCYRSKIVRDCFVEHAGQFQQMMWPSKWPDVNPIEHIWSIIEMSVLAQNPAQAAVADRLQTPLVNNSTLYV